MVLREAGVSERDRGELEAAFHSASAVRMTAWRTRSSNEVPSRGDTRCWTSTAAVDRDWAVSGVSALVRAVTAALFGVCEYI